MLKQLSTLLSLEEQNNPLLNMWGLCNCNVLCTPTCLIDLHVLGFILTSLILSYHHPCLRIDAMYWMLFLFRCVSTSPGRIRSWCEQRADVKINNTDDQYMSINEEVKKKNPEYLFFLVINNKASSPPSEPMFQSISKLTILHHPVQLSFINR
jgi:hypothetical protein